MRNINELIGIINGISYDGIINKLEVARLSSWVKKNRNLSYEHKQAHLISLVEQVLEDGIITDEEDKIDWVRETVAELEKLEVVDDGQGYPSVNHPIFTVQEERTEDNYFCYPVYNSLFYRNCGVKVCKRNAYLLDTEGKNLPL